MMMMMMKIQVMMINIPPLWGTPVLGPRHPSYVTFHYFANDYAWGHGAQVLHVVKDGDDACIFLLW